MYCIVHKYNTVLLQYMFDKMLAIFISIEHEQWKIFHLKNSFNFELNKLEWSKILNKQRGIQYQ